MLLVTGGTGFIGGHLLERLSRSGIPAKSLLRAARPLPPGIQPVIADVGQAAEGVDTVIHLAGVTKALRPADYYVGNVDFTRRLADAFRGRSVRFVHVSSLAAVGPNLDQHPITHYGKSKLEAERIVLDRIPGAIILRPAVVYGPRDTDVFQMLQSVARGYMLQIAGPERWFSAIYVDDVVDALLAPHPAGRYFLAHPEPVSWTQLGQTAARIMNRALRIIRVPVPAAHLAGLFADAASHLARKPGIISREKIREALCPKWTCTPDFPAPTSLEEGLRRTLAWYKEAGWLKF